MIGAAKSPIPTGLQPLDLHQRVLSLLVYLDQHGFRVAYELWQDRHSVVWALRPIDDPTHGTELALHDPCQEELYFDWARAIVQLDQNDSREARSIKETRGLPRSGRGQRPREEETST